MSHIIPFPRNAPTHKQDLRAALQSMQELQISGYRIEQGESNCVVVLRNGHVLGLWHWGDGYYHYTPTSYGRPTFKTESLALARRHMRGLVCPASGEFSRYAGCERRRHERIHLNWPGVLYSVIATEIVLLEDVSAGGLGIRSCADLIPGDTLRVEMHSGFHVIGRVVRARDDKIGFANLHFLQPGDPLILAVNAAAASRNYF
jgi:PilZ domain